MRLSCSVSCLKAWLVVCEIGGGVSVATCLLGTLLASTWAWFCRAVVRVPPFLSICTLFPQWLHIATSCSEPWVSRCSQANDTFLVRRGSWGLEYLNLLWDSWEGVALSVDMLNWLVVRGLSLLFSPLFWDSWEGVAPSADIPDWSVMRDSGKVAERVLSFSHAIELEPGSSASWLYEEK